MKVDTFEGPFFGGSDKPPAYLTAGPFEGVVLARA